MYALVECMTRLKGMYSLWPKVHKWYMCLGSGAFLPQVHLRARLVPHVRAKVGFERIILGISTC
ncbi:hypothetical protein ANAPC5_00258 [Anaplasma phagocytophilum]|nr:hypothetical protein ANAPC3_00054 [Anaplasma phagocytophilum]SBO30736.1 hypothetical protein ANAPC4_00281 [Anaplasma phagocytophilum]SBO30926.1 hypothetical protein ANAPC4_00334 [Anaplasma phagocytophilum]SBO31232.1 hypothetical protein ANAPC2_00563 [Anaplasma phagocytophilum]SCV62471.1 hypothetical protein ANAPC5_00258 [Anaplasma phagocytophilum]